MPPAGPGPIIRRVAQFRRLHVPAVREGDLPLDPGQARHARAVLRLEEGAQVEVFDDGGNVASGTLVYDAQGASVRVTEVRAPAPAGSRGLSWGVASAVPKGERADWMFEKLSELGAAEFIPLVTARSVVHPEGRDKRERWQRLATESAKQSRRAGVMRIGELTPLEEAVRRAAGPGGGGCFLSTEAEAPPLTGVALDGRRALTLFVGPEGGWAPAETQLMRDSGLTPAHLTTTILRIETAAVAAAAIVGTLLAR